MPRAILVFAILYLLLPATCRAVDFFFIPDTASGDIGDTVQFSGCIGPSDSMRGFTVYLGYDTTRIRLAPPPEPGELIAGHEGLQFYYYDHTWINPDRLDIGAAVYSTDYWAGPGELFRVKFVLLRCGDEPIIAPYFPRFVAPEEKLDAVDIRSSSGADLRSRARKSIVFDHSSIIPSDDHTAMVAGDAGHIGASADFTAKLCGGEATDSARRDPPHDHRFYLGHILRR